MLLKKPRAVPPDAFGGLPRGQRVELFAVAREQSEYAWGADNFKFCPQIYFPAVIHQVR